MYIIKKTTFDEADKILINVAPWGDNGYKHNISAQLVYDATGFIIKFTVNESNPKREKTHNFEYVHEDSCVEFFANFTPKSSKHYINFEANANGVMNAAFRTDRHNAVLLKNDEIKSFNIKVFIDENFWTITYKISFDFIKSYFPDFHISDCEYITANLYKCGDKTETEHYLSCFEINTNRPDFHRPEFFQKIFIK